MDHHGSLQQIDEQPLVEVEEGRKMLVRGGGGRKSTALNVWLVMTKVALLKVIQIMAPARFLTLENRA